VWKDKSCWGGEVKVKMTRLKKYFRLRPALHTDESDAPHQFENRMTTAMLDLK
jgi:hypothetical protein